MAKFNAFDENCDASAVLLLLGGVPVFSAAVQAAAADVRMARNDWAHCVFSKWDEAKFQQSFIEMEDLVRTMALPTADEGKIITELNDWETKGTQLCMNSPVDPALLQLVQQEVKSLQDDVKNMSVKFKEEKAKVQQELQRITLTLEELKQRVQRLEDFQEEANQRFGLVEDQVHNLQGKVVDLTIKAKQTMSRTSCQDSPMPAVNPEKLVELIRRDYKGAVLCPFSWCEEELQFELPNIFTRLEIKSKTKERAKLTEDTVNMTDVFRPHPECATPRVVLIEGDPGMGKTTYCQKLAYDWSVGEIPPEASFPKVEILLLLKCRDMNSANIEEAIDDQLLPEDVDEKEKVNLFHFIRSNQSRILLVIDGLDELRRDLFQGVLPLIQGKVFSRTHLMLTARHEAGRKVRRYCDSLLEIVGYTRVDAEKYIYKYFRKHEDPDLPYETILRLTGDAQLMALATNPLNTALLCLVCEETKGVFPSKRTELYGTIVECVLRREFLKRGVSLDDDSPTERCKEELNQLGKMAFEALLKDQLYFSEDEMKCQSTDFVKLPFLSRKQSDSKLRPTPCYEFTHKSFQEYFAALYLTHQVLTGDRESVALPVRLSPPAKYGWVWEFLFTMIPRKSAEKAVSLVSCLCEAHKSGLPEASITETGAIADVNSDMTLDKDKPCEWKFALVERWSDDETLASGLVSTALRFIAGCEDGKKELKDYQKEMVHELAQSFPLRKLNLVIVGFPFCLVSSEYLKAVSTLADLHLFIDYQKELLIATMEDALHPEHKLVNLTLQGASFIPYLYSPTPVSMVQWLAKVVQSGRLLTHLSFRWISLCDVGVKTLSGMFQSNCTVTHLQLDQAMIRDPGAAALANALQANSILTHLSLTGNWIGGVGAEALAKCLQTNRTLKYLDLSVNAGGDSVALALAQALESDCSLTYLDLRGAEESILRSQIVWPFPEVLKLIGESGASALATAVRSNCILTCLDLTDNKISHSGAVALGEALKSNHVLTHLYLKSNAISDSGTAALGEGLKSNHVLTYLDLDGNAISDSGAAALGEALKSNHALTHLFLNGNAISDTGAEALGEALKSNHTLTHLYLNGNAIRDSGAAALGEALKSNHALSHLYLNGNAISDLGAAALGEALKSNHALTHLYLNSNVITDSRAAALAGALRPNRTLMVYISPTTR